MSNNDISTPLPHQATQDERGHVAELRSVCRRAGALLAATVLLATPCTRVAEARLRSSKTPTYAPVATCFVEVSSTVKETAVNAFGEMSAQSRFPNAGFAWLHCADAEKRSSLQFDDDASTSGSQQI